MKTEEFQEKYGIIGNSKRIKDLVDIIQQIARSDISILITGESGVGKEVFARTIHGASNRSKQKLVNLNCGAIPEGLIESELFGHEKGSFTGASDVRKGYFEIADKGTLFLDEIGELPYTTQVKLLRVLETKEFMRIGSERVTSVDVRIIAATNKSLEHEVVTKQFRNDLFFRLKAVTLTIPPLREREEDILPFANHFIENYCERNNLPEFEFDKNVPDLLVSYQWPGNVRELKNTIESALALNRDGKITANSFDLLLSPPAAFTENRNLPIHLNKPSDALDREMIYRALIEIKKDVDDLKDMARLNLNNVQNSDFQFDEVIPINELEKRAIENALIQTKWNKKTTAKLLNISERTLYRKLKEYEIN